MDLNKIIFPAPRRSYNPSTLSQLIWVPRTRFFSMKRFMKSMGKYEDFHNNHENSQGSSTTCTTFSTSSKEQAYIPCHYQHFGEGTNDIILYFHGNAEDIGTSANFTKKLGMEMNTQVLAVEYPGYGMYEGHTNEKTMKEDAEIVFDFLTNELGIDPKNIIVFGRSMGSGPATHLAANRNPGALVLMSAYTSIRSVVKDKVGGLLSGLLAERFTNIKEIEKAECPCLFIHGKMDRVIRWEHSKKLYERCKAKAILSLSDTMTHNYFKVSADITIPFRGFLDQHGFTKVKGQFTFPDYVLRMPLKKDIKVKK